MANRAQRRAQARNKDAQTLSREQRSANDQATFEARADRVARTNSGVWRPGKVEDNVIPTPQEVEEQKVEEQEHRKHTGLDVAKFISWLIIVLSALAFMIVMWIPRLPMWVIILVSAIFVVGVLSLFIVRSPHYHNPYLDENGTAV
jgi:Flp pilus assembly protein TadB